MDDHDNDWLDELDDAPAVHTIDAVKRSDEFVEWSCSTCGRRVQVAHAGGLTVLHPGDPKALHYGGTGVRLSAPSSGDKTPPPSETIH